MSQPMETLLDRLRRIPGARVAGPASIYDIADAEAALGAPVEGQYRQFLEAVGCADLGGIGVLGVGPGVPPHLRLVEALRQARQGPPALPPHLLPVHLGGGNPYCLDTRVRGEPPMVLFDLALGEDQLPYRVAESFGEWLARLCEAADPG
jgi:hypothetical protein